MMKIGDAPSLDKNQKLEIMKNWDVENEIWRKRKWKLINMWNFIEKWVVYEERKRICEDFDERSENRDENEIEMLKKMINKE